MRSFLFHTCWPAVRRLGLWLGCLLLPSALAAAGAGDGTLTTCGSIHALSREQANAHLPVRVRGVVTLDREPNSPPSRDYFAFVIQDATAGIYVSGTRTPVNGLPRFTGENRARVGTVVEVTGVTVPGGFAPCILATSFRELGPSPPPPVLVTGMKELLTGCHDCEWVEMVGVVQRRSREREMNDGRLRLEIATAEGAFSAMMAEAGTLGALNLVDATVRMRGVCFTVFNPRGESTGVVMHLASYQDVTVLEPAPTDPYQAPLAPALALRPYSPAPPSLHRVRVAGTVTLWRPGECLYLEGPERAFRINTLDTTALAVGDVVEAVGFVGLTESFAVINEAVFRKTGHAAPPVPLPVTRAQVLKGSTSRTWNLKDEDFDGRLISIEGRLLRAENSGEGHQKIYLDCEGVLTTATLSHEVPAEVLLPFLPGSDVRVTGICSVQLGPLWPIKTLHVPTSLSVQLRGPEDIAVLATPSWWTAPRLAWTLALATVLLAALGAWIFTLRRVVTAQTDVIRHQVARQSTLEERQHIGRELHDTLQQELTGIGLLIGNSREHLDQPDKARETLRMAERMVLRCGEESRLSIHDLMSATLANRGLPAAIDELVRPLAEMNGATFHKHLLGTPRHLPALVATALLRIAHEAAANAGRHSAAREVRLTLDYEPDKVLLTVCDDGHGFDPDAPVSPQTRHFGLLGMEERAVKLRGQFHLTSAPGTGTTIAVSLPCP